MYGGLGLKADSGSISGPHVLPMRSSTGCTSVPCRAWVTIGSAAFLNAMMRCG